MHGYETWGSEDSVRRQPNRRQFLRRSTAATSAIVGATALGGFAGSSSLLPAFGAVTDAQARLRPEDVRFSDDVEPIVRLLEETPRDRVIEEVATRVKNGRLSYREVLAALLLAGVRNVQPRPSVGFKFHAVLVVNSCHLASLASPDADRWLPIFWGIDYFKSSQAQDVREGNWTMAAVDEARVPAAHRAASSFIDAMDSWDEEAADVAAAGIVRALPTNEVFELLTRYAARDFRSIGHKAIYVANAYRTLNCIGWQYAEPVIRSLTYALLNHEGQPNPATSDLDADRPWRENMPLAEALDHDWYQGDVQPKATLDLLQTIRSEDSSTAASLVAAQLGSSVSPQSVIDGLLVSSGELLMRQPGIVGLHTLTTTNAIRYLYATTQRDETRRMLLLQNAAFLPMFRQEMERRGDVADRKIDEMDATPVASDDNAFDRIFDEISRDRGEAAGMALGAVTDASTANDFIQRARQLVFRKGSDSHDYKFSSAVLEDYYHLSPEWRSRFLAASVFQLRGSGGRELPLVSRIQNALEV